jgi:hypothetical protein
MKTLTLINWVILPFSVLFILWQHNVAWYGLLFTYVMDMILTCILHYALSACIRRLLLFLGADLTVMAQRAEGG